jgi:hypothetical protein
MLKKSFYFGVLVIITQLLPACAIFAQNIQYTNYSTEDGLPSPETNDLSDENPNDQGTKVEINIPIT